MRTPIDSEGPWKCTDLRNSKEVDGVAYEVDCALVTVKAGADVDIGTFICLDQFLAILICSDQI